MTTAVRGKATITCPKCQAIHNVGLMRRLNRMACLKCSEPLRELIDLDRATWEEGDFTHEAKCPAGK